MQQGGGVFVEGLRTRALSGENAGRGIYAADQVDGGAGKPGCRLGGRDRACPSSMHSDIWSGSVGLSGVTVRPGDLSVCVDLTSRGYSSALGCAG